MILLTSKTTKLDILQENVKAAFLRRTDICVGAVGLAIRGGVGKTSGDEGHKPCTRASELVIQLRPDFSAIATFRAHGLRDE
jgi:hypothetical protein